MGTLVEAQHLKKYFPSGAGMVHAVDDVSFKIEEGTTMGLVGESGCGKSTLGRTLIHLQKSTGGKIIFDGKDITHLNRKELFKMRDDMQIIFQDPYSSLNPRMTVREVIQEPLILSKRFHSKIDLEKEADRIMDLVGIEKRLHASYPHELDGGRRQRVGIARALSLNPRFVVCDEPVSALDVSIQAQILNLLMDLQEECNLTYLFVTHDLSVVQHISDYISVMYLGQMVESCTTEELFKHQFHPYSKALLSAVLSANIHKPKERILLKGELTSPINPKPGCRFAPRCVYATEECSKPIEMKELTPGHFCACCRAKEINNL